MYLVHPCTIDSIMAYRDIVTDIGRVFLAGTVNNSSILDIDLVANPDGMKISSDNGIIPN